MLDFVSVDVGNSNIHADSGASLISVPTSDSVEPTAVSISGDGQFSGGRLVSEHDSWRFARTYFRRHTRVSALGDYMLVVAPLAGSFPFVSVEGLGGFLWAPFCLLIVLFLLCWLLTIWLTFLYGSCCIYAFL